VSLKNGPKFECIVKLFDVLPLQMSKLLGLIIDSIRYETTVLLVDNCSASTAISRLCIVVYLC